MATDLGESDDAGGIVLHGRGLRAFPRIVSLNEPWLCRNGWLLHASSRCWLLTLQLQCEAVPAVKKLWDEWREHGDDDGFRPVTASEVNGRPVQEQWSDIVKEAFNKAAEGQWHYRVQSETSATGRGGNKLRTYARFKFSLALESYLSVNVPRKIRSFLSRFRMGVAPLQIEMGRRRDEGDVAARACPVCGAGRMSKMKSTSLWRARCMTRFASPSWRRLSARFRLRPMDDG